MSQNAHEDERLADWVDGRMTERQRAAFEAEMRARPELAEAAHEYARFTTRLRELSHDIWDEHPRADLTDRIVGAAAAEAESRPRGRGAGFSPWTGSLLAAAALVLVFVGLAWLPNDDFDTAPMARTSAREDGADADIAAFEDEFVDPSLEPEGSPTPEMEERLEQKRASGTNADSLDRRARGRQRGAGAPPSPQSRSVAARDEAGGLDDVEKGAVMRMRKERTQLSDSRDAQRSALDESLPVVVFFVGPDEAQKQLDPKVGNAGKVAKGAAEGDVDDAKNRPSPGKDAGAKSGAASSGRPKGQPVREQPVQSPKVSLDSLLAFGTWADNLGRPTVAPRSVIEPQLEQEQRGGVATEREAQARDSAPLPQSLQYKAEAADRCFELEGTAEQVRAYLRQLTRRATEVEHLRVDPTRVVAPPTSAAAGTPAESARLRAGDASKRTIRVLIVLRSKRK